MKQKNQKIAILGIIFLLSTIFFLAAFNRMLIPSKAVNAAQVKAYILEDEIKCNPSSDGVCRMHLFIENQTTAKMIGLSGRIKYSDGLSFYNFNTDTLCASQDVGLDLELKSKNDPAGRFIDFAYGTLKKDDELKSEGCVKTIFFKPENAKSGMQANVSLSTDLSLWQAVGSTEITVTVNPKITKIVFDDNTQIDIPTDKPTLTPVPSGSCVQFTKGDCNCDGKIDMIDAEMIRQAMFNEKAGLSCDFNADSKTDKKDYDVWVFNASPQGSGPNLSPYPSISISPETSISPTSGTSPTKNARDAQRIRDISTLQGVLTQVIADVSVQSLIDEDIYTVTSDNLEGATDCDWNWTMLPLCPYINSVPVDPVNQYSQYIRADQSSNYGKLVYQINVDRDLRYRICARFESEDNAGKLKDDNADNDYYEVFSSASAPACNF